jgi:hypothetical protein
MMMFEKLDFMPVSNHLLSIKNILDRLPDSYKDVKQIREDYIYINSKFELLMNKNLPIETMHSAAMSLLKKDTQCENWDIKSAIYDLAHDPILLWAILLGRWEDSNGKYISVYSLYDEEDNYYPEFDTNLKTDLEELIAYQTLFSGNPVALGYHKFLSPEDRVYTCSIVDISYQAIKVCCLYDGQYYTLKYQH